MSENSFYGSLKYPAQSSFIFDRIYPNRVDMEDAIVNGTDGVFINRFVLVSYNYNKNSKKWEDRYRRIYYVSTLPTINSTTKTRLYYLKTKYTDNNTNTIYDIGFYNVNPSGNAWITYPNPTTQWQRGITLAETSLYTTNRNTDQNKYGQDYDGTIWMKVYLNGQESYQLISKITADYNNPTFEFIQDAPYDTSNNTGDKRTLPSMEIDYQHSGNLNYKVIVPGLWKISNELGSLEQMGLGPATSFTNRGSEPTGNNSISFTPQDPTNSYPKLKLQEIALTEETYEPNRYYNSNWQKITANNFVNGFNYYTVTLSGENTQKYDTYKLDIKLPELGRAIRFLYDGLFGIKEGGVKRPEFASMDYLIGQEVWIGDNQKAPLNLLNGLKSCKYLTDNFLTQSHVDWINNEDNAPTHIKNRPLVINNSTQINALWEQVTLNN